MFFHPMAAVPLVLIKSLMAQRVVLSKERLVELEILILFFAPPQIALVLFFFRIARDSSHFYVLS